MVKTWLLRIATVIVGFAAVVVLNAWIHAWLRYFQGR
jgi:uncharacterized membrane protein YuzA (DUF378 family)